MSRIVKTLAPLVCALLLPLSAWAVPVNVKGDYQFDGNALVDAFSIEFDTVIDVESSTEFVDLPLVSGSVTVGAKTFKESVFLRFARSPFGGFGALVLSQNTSPFSGASLPDYFEISAAFSRTTDINTIMTETVSAPLFGSKFFVAGTPPKFANGLGLGLITFSQPAPVPLPAGGMLLVSALGMMGVRRVLRKKA